MSIYLDNASTTKMFKDIADESYKAMTETYGNPSSKHSMGLQAERIIRNTLEEIGQYLKVDTDQIYFTSGGTEANNLAIQGIAKAYKRDGNHIITTAIEHSSVRETVEYLESTGYTVSFLEVDDNGLVNMEDLSAQLEEHTDTILVSVMYVNNEIGVIQDVASIGKLIKKLSPDTKFHVDGVQGFGKLPIKPQKWHIDALSISAHKIHGPKGIGALYINKNIKIAPLFFGGHQQKGIRSGTENVPGIAAFGIATKRMSDGLGIYQSSLEVIKTYMIKRLKEIDHIRVNSPVSQEFSNHILSVSFLGVRGEVLLHALADQEIYVSTGSACSSNKSQSTGFLVRIGRNTEEAESNIRFSFSKETTIEEIDTTIETLKQLLTVLRKFKRK